MALVMLQVQVANNSHRVHTPPVRLVYPTRPRPLSSLTFDLQLIQARLEVDRAGSREFHVALLPELSFVRPCGTPPAPHRSGPWCIGTSLTGSGHRGELVIVARLSTLPVPTTSNMAGTFITESQMSANVQATSEYVPPSSAENIPTESLTFSTTRRSTAGRLW